jgi:hypothetical protein
MKWGFDFMGPVKLTTSYIGNQYIIVTGLPLYHNRLITIIWGSNATTGLPLYHIGFKHWQMS